MLISKKKSYGILGGSFDPPHKGHLKISNISLKKIKLEKIFWIVTKKNPFKNKPHFSLEERISKCRKITKNNKRSLHKQQIYQNYWKSRCQYNSI